MCGIDHFFNCCIFLGVEITINVGNIFISLTLGATATILFDGVCGCTHYFGVGFPRGNDSRERMVTGKGFEFETKQRFWRVKFEIFSTWKYRYIHRHTISHFTFTATSPHHHTTHSSHHQTTQNEIDNSISYLLKHENIILHYFCYCCIDAADLSGQ